MDISGWSVTGLALALGLAGLLLAGSYYRVWKLRLGRWLALPLLFLCYCLLRCFAGIKESAPFDTFAQVASAFLGGIGLALALRAGLSFRTLVYAQVAVNLLEILIVLFGLGPEPPPGEESFRYAGLTGNANLLALQLTLGACLIWLLPKKAGIFPCAFAVGAVAFAVLVTGSRKAILIGLLFLVLVFIQLVAIVPRNRRQVVLAGALGTGALAALLLGQWLYQNATQILAVQRTLNYDDSSYRKRVDMLQEGLRLWHQAPLFGNGVDSFRGLSGEGTYSHNNYVELLCDLGLVGAILFYGLYAQILFRAAQAKPLTRLYCWIFVLTLVLADVAYVSYKSKQSIMLLMLLTVVSTSHYAFRHRRHSGKHRHHQSGLHVHPRRFVFRT